MNALDIAKAWRQMDREARFARIEVEEEVKRGPARRDEARAKEWLSCAEKCEKERDRLATMLIGLQYGGSDDEEKGAEDE
jgi:hypothetical protein